MILNTKAGRIVSIVCCVLLMLSSTLFAQKTDPQAENMLAYQRQAGGWPKAVNGIKVDYSKALSVAELKKIKADSAGIDATFDNKATSREINYLVKAYKETANPAYLASVEKGLKFIFKAQYPNGGWPQYYPDKNIYRSQITFNDDAMVNVLNILQDITDKKNGYDVLNPSYITLAQAAIERAVGCILKTQLKVGGKLTGWCTQYNKDSMQPEKARAYELPSISGAESVGIVKFLMRLPNPSAEVKAAIKNAVDWLNEVKITGYSFKMTADQALGKDGIVVPDPSSTIWARFYEIGTNRPFFCGRDGVKKYSLVEIEQERRGGYAWYGQWAQQLINKDYPNWQKRNY